MTEYLNGFFSREITCIPAILKSSFGDYFDNALCNASTWAVVGWSLLHWVFDNLLYNIFRKLRYKDYVCQRLTKSLWYWGFYGTSLIYCGTTLAHSEMELFNFKRMTVPTEKTVPVQVVVGYTLINTFYIHSALWESSNLSECVIYLLLATVCSVSYILRVPEICFTLTALIAISKFLIENTRLVYMFFGHGGFFKRFAVWFSFMVAFAFFIAIHIIVVPLTFIVPLGLKVLSDYPDVLLIILCTALLLWLMVELYNSILFQFFDHWFYHNNKEVGYQCDGNTLECALFTPRTDEAYNLQIIRREIKKKEQEAMSRRKPKNKNVLLQTLKCMVAIKKKISTRKLHDSPSQIQMISRNKNNPVIDDSDEEVEEVLNVLEHKQKALNVDIQDSTDSDDEATDSEDVVITTHKSLMSNENIKEIDEQIESEDEISGNTDISLQNNERCSANKVFPSETISPECVNNGKQDDTLSTLANIESCGSTTCNNELNKAQQEKDNGEERSGFVTSKDIIYHSSEEQQVDELSYEPENLDLVTTGATPTTTKSVGFNNIDTGKSEEKADPDSTSPPEPLSPPENVSGFENDDALTHTRPVKSVHFADISDTKDSKASNSKE